MSGTIVMLDSFVSMFSLFFTRDGDERRISEL